MTRLEKIKAGAERAITENNANLEEALRHIYEPSQATTAVANYAEIQRALEEIDWLVTRVKLLEAERDRLREALESLHDCAMFPGKDKSIRPHDVVNAALAGEAVVDESEIGSGDD